MNPAAVLALIGDLYAQISVLTEENAALRAQLGTVSPGDRAPEQDSDDNG